MNLKKTVGHFIVGCSFGLCLWFFFNSLLNIELMQNIILYYFCLFCYGLIVGLICNRMFISSYLGIVLGQFIYLFFLVKIGSFIMIEVVYIFIFSILVFFGNAIGVLISTK